MKESLRIFVIVNNFYLLMYKKLKQTFLFNHLQSLIYYLRASGYGNGKKFKIYYLKS